MAIVDSDAECICTTLLSTPVTGLTSDHLIVTDVIPAIIIRPACRRQRRARGPAQPRAPWRQLLRVLVTTTAGLRPSVDLFLLMQ